MTVSYTIDSRLGAFIHLFARWKGSIFKLVWPDLTIFLILYFSCSALYRFGLDESQQRLFERVATYCEKYGTLIPVSFVLGFYVSLVIGRWWAQYKIIPWIDTVAIWVSMSVKGVEDDDRLIRRTICRYCVLSITQCFTLISSQAKKRFPTLDHLIVAGLLLENEKTNMENVVACLPKYQTHWIPLVWASNIVSKARIEGKINSDSWMKALIDEINKIKDQCNRLLCFDRIRVPLVYTQVVTLAVYSYFFSCIMGRQWIHIKPKSEETISAYNSTATARSSVSSSGKYGVDELDLIVPIFTILQFLFYIGWLKVAGSLVNPFGDDDYDFELNWMIDRHLQVSYSIVDNMHFQNPELVRDPYWGEKVPRELPHTIASLKCNNDPPVTSTSTVIVSNDESEILTPATLLSIHTIAKADIKFRKRNVLAAKKLLLQQQLDENSENQNLTDEAGNENNETRVASLTAVENDESIRNSNVISPDVFSTTKKEE